MPVASSAFGQAHSQLSPSSKRYRTVVVFGRVSTLLRVPHLLVDRRTVCSPHRHDSRQSEGEQAAPFSRFGGVAYCSEDRSITSSIGQVEPAAIFAVQKLPKSVKAPSVFT